MIWIKENSLRAFGDGSTFVADLFADTVNDLTTTVEGLTLEKGSIAYVIETGDFYVLNSNNEWKISIPENTTNKVTSAKNINEVTTDDLMVGSTESE